MKSNNLAKLLAASLVLIMSLWAAEVSASPRIAVLDFELKDMTLMPGVPAELARTASIKPLLETALKQAGYDIVDIGANAQRAATAGEGYLFDHPDAAAQLGSKHGVDYVLVGRLHKPSFLFFYLLAHLVDVRKEALAGDYQYEVKGGEKKLIARGVSELAEKINKSLAVMK